MASKHDYDEDILNYPKSRSSQGGSEAIVRSQTWCEDITHAWNTPIAPLESLEERVQRYKVYFTMTPQQIKLLLNKFLSEIQCGLELHKIDPQGTWESSKCSLKMLDTCVTPQLIPRGNEKGTAFALDFAGADVAYVRGVKVNLEGSNKISTSGVGVSLRDATMDFPKGLLDRKSTASMLFNCFAGVVKELVTEKGGASGVHDEIGIGFAVGFPAAQRSLSNASLIHWTKGYETGRASDDPVEGMDVAALLDCAFWRAKLKAKTRAVVNDTTGALLTCCYESPPKLPPCKVGFVLGAGVNGGYVTSESKREYGYIGCLVNCEIGGFDKSLPLNDVDLEIDFADETTKGSQLYEKMVSTTYLGELCRRLVVKIWQNEAPQLAWVRHSLPWLACARVISDTESPERTTTGEILYGLWEWETTLEQRAIVQDLFQTVFDRSAALAAVAIVALASKTERLQPAMGGLTCAIGGTLCSSFPGYLAKLRSYIDATLEPVLALLIHLHPVEDCSAKGAGILAWKSAFG